MNYFTGTCSRNFELKKKKKEKWYTTTDALCSSYSRYTCTVVSGNSSCLLRSTLTSFGAEEASLGTVYMDHCLYLLTFALALKRMST